MLPSQFMSLYAQECAGRWTNWERRQEKKEVKEKQDDSSCLLAQSLLSLSIFSFDGKLGIVIKPVNQNRNF